MRRLYAKAFAPKVSSRPLFNSTVTSFGDGTGLGSFSATLPNTALSFAWDFGDAPSGTANRGAGRAVQHRYSVRGAYTVVMAVIDSGVVVATRSETAVVQ